MFDFLYRDVSAYPDLPRSQLQTALRDYVDYTIHEAWPQQARGKVPVGGVAMMNRFQTTLVSFEPTTDGQKLLHGETLGAYNHLIETRRLRLDAVRIGLPDVLWFVVFAGAAISLSASFFFKVEDARLHGILVVLLAIFIGLIIFMILALDRPFRGDLGLRPDSYQLLLDHLMSTPVESPK